MGSYAELRLLGHWKSRPQSTEWALGKINMVTRSRFVALQKKPTSNIASYRWQKKILRSLRDVHDVTHEKL